MAPNKKTWGETKKRSQKVQKGETDCTYYIPPGKGLKFCPKSRSHDMIKLTEETFKYNR